MPHPLLFNGAGFLLRFTVHEIQGLGEIHPRISFFPRTRVSYHRASEQEEPIQSWWQDLRYAVRMLDKNVTLTFVIVTSLAIGIGANAAILSVVDVLTAWSRCGFTRRGLASFEIGLPRDNTSTFKMRTTALRKWPWHKAAHSP